MEQEPPSEASESPQANDLEKRPFGIAPVILAALTWLGMAAMWLVVGGLLFYVMLFSVFFVTEV